VPAAPIVKDQNIPHTIPFFSVIVAVYNDWLALDGCLQSLAQQTDGPSFEMVVVDGEHDVRARFFERGVGETESSGTGSCASAVAALNTDKVESPVRVHAPGGAQTVRQENNLVFLRGSARLVCRGEFF